MSKELILVLLAVVCLFFQSGSTTCATAADEKDRGHVFNFPFVIYSEVLILI